MVLVLVDSNPFLKVITKTFMAKRKRFNQTDLLKRLVDVKPVCKKCGRTALQVQLDLHHKDGVSSNDNWRNIVIYCRACHNDKHGTVPRKRKI